MSAVNPTASAASDIKVLTTEGRIGRLRYIAYSVGISLAMVAVELIFFGLYVALGGHISFNPPVHHMQFPVWLNGLIYCLDAVGLVFAFIFAIRRIRDFNASGWWSLLILVPLVNFIFFIALLIIPGTRGSNRFGPQPPANSGGVIALATIWFAMIILAVLGIIAAIAIPAYQDYAHHGRMAPQQYQMQQYQRQ